MVKPISVERNKTKNTVLKKAASKTVSVKNPTHLYLHDKFITVLENIPTSDNLTVLYLHNNGISKIENLNSAINLKSLYLQKNKISKIENLECLKNLKKLYLGHNEISVVEGLENLYNLEELHIEKQRLEGDALCFDPRSVTSISKSLQVLNISQNNITTIANLSPLKHIKVINISHNKLAEIREVCSVVSNWFYLYNATLIGNPIVKQHRYRENLIANTYRLAILDSKEITDTTRCFIKRLEQEKINHTGKPVINLAEKISGIPKTYPLPIQKAVSQSLLKSSNPWFDDKSTMGCDANEIYLTWNALPKSSSGRQIPGILKTQQKRPGKRIAMETTFPNL